MYAHYGRVGAIPT